MRSRGGIIIAEHKHQMTFTRDIACRGCGSKDVSKYGKYKDTQYYICKKCQTKFCGKNCYPRMKHPKVLNISALTYYYNGMSLRNVNHTIDDLYDMRVPKMTLWRWITKYSQQVNDYVLTLKPELSDVWLADETAVKIWGEQYWFWDIIDTETRFLLASHLSKTRTERDAIKLFHMAKLRSKYRPSIIITDKLGQYNKAFSRVFYAMRDDDKVFHLKSEGFNSPININILERFHGSIKQRTKVMRDLKEPKSARIILDGYVTHYDFFMEHDSLGGRTPAKVCGIGDGIRNWGDLIDLSCNVQKEKPEIKLEWEEEFKVERTYDGGRRNVRR